MKDYNNGIAQISVTSMVSLISNAFSTVIEKNLPFTVLPAVMLWGPPGVGKSQGVRQAAAKITEVTGKKVNITDVRLQLFNPVDLRGIPTANEDKTLAIWLKPKIFQMDESNNVVNILFLDEISAAPQSVQAAAYQITLDRTVGEHKLPDNCFVIAAGNRITDRSVAFNMPKALANRLCHLEITSDIVSWRPWAVEHGIHEIVLGYMDYNSVALNRFDSTAGEMAFPTPRTWEMVSNILNYVSDNLNTVYPMIVGCIGANEASALRVWSEIYRSLPEAEEIFLGNTPPIPKKPEALYALISRMSAYARKCVNGGMLSNSVAYACNFPWEFRTTLLKDYSDMSNVRAKLANDLIFSEWMARHGSER